MVSAKLIFFTMSMVLYSFYVFRGPFLRVYLKVDVQQLGNINAAVAAVSFPCVTLWNTTADYLGRHRSILIFITLASVAAFDSLVFRFPGNQTWQTWYAMIMLSVYAAFTAGMMPLLDYEALKLLASRSDFTKEMYGRQRLWGTLAYAVSTLVAAYMMEKGGYGVLFVLMPASAIIFVATILVAGPADEPKSWAQIRARFRGESVEGDEDEEEELVDAPKNVSPNSADSKLTDKSANTTPSAYKAGTEADDKPDSPSQISTVPTTQKPATKRRSPWRRLLTNPNFLFFLFAVFMNGTARTVMTSFLSNYWKEDCRLKETYMAVATIFGIAIEVVIFLFGSFLAPLGNYWMLVIGQAAMVMRCWAYTQWLVPGRAGLYWQVWIVELLKGVAFGFTHTAGVRIAAEAAPKGLEATAQALYTSMYAQLPAVIASAGGGKVYKAYGPTMLFLITSIISTTALGLFILKYSVEGKIRLWPAKRPETPAAVSVE